MNFQKIYRIFKRTIHFVLLFSIFLMLLISCNSSKNVYNGDFTSHQKLYVLNSGSNNLSVIDPTDNRVIKTIQVGEKPNSMSFSSSELRLFVSNLRSKNISIIDIVSDKVIKKIELNAFPVNLSVSDGKRLYILVYPDTTVVNRSQILTVNLDTYDVIDSLQIQDSCTQFNSILVIDDKQLYGACNLLPTCFVKPQTPLIIDLVRKEIINQNSIPAKALGITPDKSSIYLTGINFIYIFNLVESRLLSISENGDFTRVTFSNKEAKAYVANPVLKNILIMNTTSRSIVSKIELDFEPFGLTISEDNQLLYVTSPENNRVAVINLRSGKIVKTIPVGVHPTDLLFTTLPL